MSGRAAWGWCPSVLRPMPLDDGLMVRIRVWMNTLTPEQAFGLAVLAERHGAGVIELTSRANIQLRGLSEADHAALVPMLDDLGLTRVDRSASARVNVTLSPFGARNRRIAAALSDALTDARHAALPEKFGFVVDAGETRALADTPGDIRIEASGSHLILRADGQRLGARANTETDAVTRALDMADWFIATGGVDAEGRGRMAPHAARHPLPGALHGTKRPNPAETPATTGPAWLKAGPRGLCPADLRAALTSEVKELRLTPFRALFLPDRAAALAPADNGCNTAVGSA